MYEINVLIFPVRKMYENDTLFLCIKMYEINVFCEINFFRKTKKKDNT